MGQDIYLFPSIAVASNKQRTTDIYHSGLSQSCRSNSEKLLRLKKNNRHVDDICPRLLLPMKETDRVAVMLIKLKAVKVNKYNFLS